LVCFAQHLVQLRYAFHTIGIGLKHCLTSHESVMLAALATVINPRPADIMTRELLKLST